MSARRRSPLEIADELRHLAAQSGTDRASLLHELHVHQEELTAQNQELIHAQATLEEARDRFVELYDLAPNGYLTLDFSGIVLQINLRGATMLGQRRDAIEGLPLLGFVVQADRSRLLEFLRCCATADGGHVSAELAMSTADGERQVQLSCRPSHRDAEDRQRFFTSMIDVTEYRRLEAEREAAAREHAALASRLISVQDEERQRIARDLHDNLGQQVTALRLLLDVMSASAAGDFIRRGVEKAQSIVAQLDSQLDFLTRELRPVALDLGAVSAIRQFVDEWAETFGIAAEFRSDGLDDLRLSGDVETHLYRVVQEALNNVAKHAGARNVVVQFVRRGGMLVLTVSDDGRGFDTIERARTRSQTSGSGLGLVGMRERALIIGGTIDVHSVPGQRTTVTLRIPAVTSPAQTG